MKSLITPVLSLALLVSAFGTALPAVAATPNWNASGSYVVTFSYLGSDFAHDMVLSQDGAGLLTGSGGSPSGSNVYTWVITSGSVSADTIDFTADYTATADAVTPQTTMHVTGTIASNGTMSGTWSDNYQGGARSGTWSTTSGTAAPVPLAGTLAAEDFGVVNYDTGLGILKGYSAGFGLTDATFAGAQSVVVKLYASTTLLQTNTATAKLGVDVTGAQISSPFDVSGTFDYATDGYWTNVRQAEFGQSVAATRVVATVTLANGKVVTAENTVLSGDPSSIFKPTTTPTSPTTKAECKNDGWKTFTNPVFKNQGQCISFVNKLDDDEDKPAHHEHEDRGEEEHHGGNRGHGHGGEDRQREDHSGPGRDGHGGGKGRG